MVLSACQILLKSMYKNLVSNHTLSGIAFCAEKKNNDPICKTQHIYILILNIQHTVYVTEFAKGVLYTQL